MYHWLSVGIGAVRDQIDQHPVLSWAFLVLVCLEIGRLLKADAIRGITSGVRNGCTWLRSQMMVVAEIDGDDAAAEWLQIWLAKQPYMEKARRVTVSCQHNNINPDYDFEIAACDRDESPPKRAVYAAAGFVHKMMRQPCVAPPDLTRPASSLRPRYQAAPGSHLFWHKRRLVWIVRHRTRQEGGGQRPMRMVPGGYEIRVFARSQRALREVVDDILNVVMPPDDPRTTIYRASEGRWMTLEHRKLRSFDSVVLDRDIKLRVLEDITGFESDAAWYESMGIPYRFGMLFEGPAGSGKSSLVQAIAGHFRLSIFILNLTVKGMNDELLMTLLHDVCDRSLLLIEDIDAAFVQRDSKATSPKNTVTFSGLLNALDGVTGSDGRITILTTNHVEKLDKALIRPGRVDLQVTFGYATDEQARTIFERFFPHADEQIMAEFGAAAAKSGVTMAQVQEFLLRYRADMNTAYLERDNIAAVQGIGQPDTVQQKNS